MPKYFEETDEAEILKEFDRTPEMVEEDIQAIKKWQQRQPHLPEITPERVIKAFLVLNKCRVEKTKQKLDMYYTIRGILPEMFNKHPMSQEMQKIARVLTYLPMPVQMEGRIRLNVCALLDDNPDNFDANLAFSHVLNVIELRLYEDISSGDISIYDFTKLKTGHALKMTPTLVKNILVVIDKVYSSRYKEVNIIVDPIPVMDKMLSLVLSVLPEKIKSRFHVHRNFDTLLKQIDKKYLPKDYGGDLKSIAELNDELLARFEDYRPRIEELMKMRTNEALRPGKPINDDILGFQGNFRKLDVD